MHAFDASLRFFVILFLFTHFFLWLPLVMEEANAHCVLATNFYQTDNKQDKNWAEEKTPDHPIYLTHSFKPLCSQGSLHQQVGWSPTLDIGGLIAECVLLKQRLFFLGSKQKRRVTLHGQTRVRLKDGLTTEGMTPALLRQIKMSPPCILTH